MAGKSYKKRSAKKSVKKNSSKRSSSKRSSSKRSSSKRSSSRKSSSRVRSHYRTVRKTRVKSHYRMKGMGHLLQMYGGASAELEAEHNACLVKYKELMGVHEQIKQVISDLRSNGASKSEINEQISKANDIREQIKDLVDGAGKCKEKQAALLESLKDVAHNVTEQLNDEVQAGGGFADWGAKLDSAGAKLSASAKAAGAKFSENSKAFGAKLSSGMKSVSSKLSSGMKSVSSKLSSGMKSAGESIKNKYGEYKEVQQAKKDAQEKIQLRKLLAKHGNSGSSASSMSSIGSDRSE